MSRPGRRALSLQVELVIWTEIQVFIGAAFWWIQQRAGRLDTELLRRTEETE